MIGTVSQSEGRVRKDPLGAPDQALQSENLTPDIQPGKKGAMRGQRRLIVELAKLMHVKEIVMKHLLAMELAVNTLIDQIVLVTTFPETYDISLHSNIHKLT